MNVRFCHLLGHITSPCAGFNCTIFDILLRQKRVHINKSHMIQFDNFYSSKTFRPHGQ